MTYGRVRFAIHEQSLNGAVVSHSAELVRGDSYFLGSSAPSNDCGATLLRRTKS